jgi:predicted O-methyltransferase YrrM
MLKEKLNSVFNAISYQKGQNHVLNHFTPQFSHNGDSTVCYGRLIEYSQRITLGVAAEDAVRNSGGNILEIGCAEGSTTCTFAEIAKKYGVKVYCIDPYSGAQEGTESVYEEFKKVCSRYPDTIIHLRDSSLSEAAKQFIKDKHISFAFVDGLHTKDAAYSDVMLSLNSMKSGDVLCVDDTNNYTDRDAGAAMIQAVNESKISKINIDESAEKIIFTHKSWHFATKQ